MKTPHALLLMVAFGTFSGLAAQDIIYRIDGTEIKAKVIEITTDAIKYRNFDQPTGPVRNILLTDVFMIIYEDGTKEVFKKPADKQPGEDDLPQQPGEGDKGSPEKSKGDSKIDITFGAKGGIYYPLGKVVKDVYGGMGMVAFHAEADLDFWTQRGWGGGIGVGYTGKEGTPYTYGHVEDAEAHITFIPIHISGGYRLADNPKAMPYFMTSFVLTPFHERLEADVPDFNAGEKTIYIDATEIALGFNVIAGIQVKPVYIEAVFSYENYDENNIGGIIVAAGVKF
jgi:hypothetical protein